MTLLPLDSWQIRGVAGPKYKVGPRCSNPDCRKVAEHAHHMWPRGFLKGDYAWVELPDGTVLGNLTGLCADCHDDITGRIGGHKAAIRLGTNDSQLWWCKVDGRGLQDEVDFVPLDLLDPQPPTRDSLVASPATSGSDDRCSTCGQPVPVKRERSVPAERSRRRKTWPVKVPADVEENGAEVLDSLTEDLAPLLGLKPDDNGAYTSARYYVLVPALYFAQQQRDEFVSAVRGED